MSWEMNKLFSTITQTNWKLNINNKKLNIFVQHTCTTILYLVFSKKIWNNYFSIYLFQGNLVKKNRAWYIYGLLRYHVFSSKQGLYFWRLKRNVI